MSILNLNDKDFEEKVLKNTNIVLCDFWAEWCGPCKQISPILEELSRRNKDSEFKIAKVNIDDNPETPAKFGIMSIPSFCFSRWESSFYTGRVTTQRNNKKMDR